MRIRKRWPTPVSSTPPPPPPQPPSPIAPPPPDPSPSTPSPQPGILHLHHHHRHGDEAAKPLHSPCVPPNQETRPRSDLQLIIIKGTNGWICSKGETDDECMHSNGLKDSQPQLEDEEGKVSAFMAIDHKNKNTYDGGARSCIGISLSSSSSSNSHHQGGKECNEEMDKSPMNKKRKKDSAIVEGSRCSRVNGRGWRCCQQTLAGYSLCEHHLGKGRLKSNITSRKTVKQATTLPSTPLESSSSSSLLFNKKLSLVPKEKQKKKLKKIGMVKARSINSLLVQTQQYAPPLDSISITTL